MAQGGPPTHPASARPLLVGSACNLRHPSSSPSCVTEQNDNRHFVSVQRSADLQVTTPGMD